MIQKRVVTLLLISLILLTGCASLSDFETLVGNNQHHSNTNSLQRGLSTDYRLENQYGEPIDFTLKFASGEDVSLEEFRGKKVYINVWASWCPPCQKEMPDLEKVYQTYKSKDDWVFVSVVSADDAKFENSYPTDVDAQKILATAKDLGVTYPVLFDAYDSFDEAWEIEVVPTHIILNSDGTVSYYLPGLMESSELQELLEETY